jgi:hypothetical protein
MAALQVTSSNRMLPTMQAVSNFARLGMEHILLISTDHIQCKQVHIALPCPASPQLIWPAATSQVTSHVPHIGCSWDKFKLPMIGEDIGVVVATAPLWHTRCAQLPTAKLPRLTTSKGQPLAVEGTRRGIL